MILPFYHKVSSSYKEPYYHCQIFPIRIDTMKTLACPAFIMSLSLLFACTDTPKTSHNFQTLEQVKDDIHKHDLENIQNSQAWQEGEKHLKDFLGENPSDEQIYAYLSDMTTDTNAHLPFQVDEITTLIKISHHDKILTYHMKIHQSKDEMNFSADMMKDVLINHNNSCGTLSAMLTRRIGVDYQYYDNNETPVYLIHIRPEDCNL